MSRPRHLTKAQEMSRLRLPVEVLVSILSLTRWTKLSQLIEGPDHLKTRCTFFPTSIRPWSRPDMDHVPATWSLPGFLGTSHRPTYIINTPKRGNIHSFTLIYSYSVFAITSICFPLCIYFIDLSVGVTTLENLLTSH